MGFGNAGVHIPHANAYPIAGRVSGFHPKDYPADEAMVPHGMSVALTAPEAFRFTFDAAPERHLRAARLLAPDAEQPPDPAEFLPAVLSELMRDIEIPNGVAAVGYTTARHPGPGRGDAEAAAAAGHLPEAGDRGRPGRHLRAVHGALVADGHLPVALRPGS